MAIVRATCPDCGEIELVSAEMSVRQCVEDGSLSYTFRCPTCKLASSKETDSRISNLLTSAGAPLVPWSRPAELNEPHSGRPICPDDLLAFHAIIESADVWSQINPPKDAERAKEES